MDFVGLESDIFHNVDFAASRPGCGRNIVSKRPECGPHSLAGGNLDACFEATILLREVSGGFQTSGSVVSMDAIGASEIFLQRLDDKVTAFLVRVLAAIRVILQFFVAPTAPASLNTPLRRVGWGAIRAVEFVTPG